MRKNANNNLTKRTRKKGKEINTKMTHLQTRNKPSEIINLIMNKRPPPKKPLNLTSKICVSIGSFFLVGTAFLGFYFGAKAYTNSIFIELEISHLLFAALTGIAFLMSAMVLCGIAICTDFNKECAGMFTIINIGLMIGFLVLGSVVFVWKDYLPEYIDQSCKD